MEFKRNILKYADLIGILPRLRHAQEMLNPSRRRATALRVRFYRTLIPRKDALVFDIGANMGNRSEVFLRLGAKVVALDPQPQCGKVLTRRFGHNPRFSFLAIGLGERPGSATMTISSSHVLSSMSQDWTKESRFGSEWLDKVEVRVSTLDAVIALYGTPDFCKIDVEGFEPQVLRGLSQPLPALSLEFNPDMADHMRECLDQLDALGVYEYGFAEGEAMTDAALTWFESRIALDERLSRVCTFGDVYARVR